TGAGSDRARARADPSAHRREPRPDAERVSRAARADLQVQAAGAARGDRERAARSHRGPRAAAIREPAVRGRGREPGAEGHAPRAFRVRGVRRDGDLRRRARPAGEPDPRPGDHRGADDEHRRLPRAGGNARPVSDVRDPGGAVSGGTSSVVGREILRSNLRAIADDMSVALEHNSPSPAVSEARDYAVAFTSAAGEVVVADNAVHVPSLAMTARAILDFFEFNLRPGDLVVTTDPYSGGTHTQDLTVFAPVYAHGELVGGLLTRVRVPDFGGQVA